MTKTQRLTIIRDHLTSNFLLHFLNFFADTVCGCCACSTTATLLSLSLVVVARRPHTIDHINPKSIRAPRLRRRCEFRCLDLCCCCRLSMAAVTTTISSVTTITARITIDTGDSIMLIIALESLLFESLPLCITMLPLLVDRSVAGSITGADGDREKKARASALSFHKDHSSHVHSGRLSSGTETRAHVTISFSHSKTLSRSPIKLTELIY